MRTEKWISAFWATLLAFAAALGSVGCVITGFDLALPELVWVVLACAAGAVIFSTCFVHRVGWFPLGVLALLGGYLWQKGPLEEAAEGLLFRISYLYDLGYGWGAVHWSQLDPSQADPTLALCFVGFLVAAAVAWTVSGRHAVWLGLFASVLPFATCLVLTNTVPDTVYICLLLSSLCLLLLTQPVRRMQMQKGNTLMTMIAVPVAAAVVILLLLFPQDGYTGQKGADKIEEFVMQVLGLEEQKEVTSSIPGNNAQNTMDLTAVGPKTYQSNKVMTLRSARTGQVYARGCAYDIYDGKNWIRSETPWTLDGEFSVTGTGFAVNINTMRPHDVKYMPQVVPQMLKNMDRGRVENRDGETRHQYVSTDLPTYEAAWENQGGSISADAAEQYLQLPTETAQWARDYLRGTVGSTAPGNSAGEIWRYAQRVAQQVQSGALYDLRTKKMPETETDFAKWFVESSETGYCVHFATATAVLLRSVGVPTRYVTGYLVNAKSHEDVTVRLRDAHAWVEVYLANVGWVVLEATPGGFGSPVPDETQPEQTQTEDTRPDDTRPAGTEESTADTVPETSLPEETVQQTLPDLDRPTSPVGGSDKPDGAEKQPDVSGWIHGVLLTLAGVFTLVAQWQLRLWLRRKKQHTGSANAQALARWQEVQTHAKLRREMPEELLALAQKARFSQHTLTRQELRAFDSYLIHSRRVLRKRPLWHRLYHTLILAIY